MICARCHKRIDSGQLYQQARQRMTLPEDLGAMDPIVSVHLDCPADMPPIPADFLDMIGCNCGHAASQHQYAIEGDAIVQLSAHTFCSQCTCHGFNTTC